MKVSTVDALTNNTGISSTEFSMKATASAFKVISNSLYENKERAVLRELSANALDAHIAVGKENVPIEITLPTTLEPNLIVKDYGIGMSYDTVTTVLVNYFSTTKNTDNNQVGGFGLGFKSPFAISESYQVSTVHKGLETTLLITLDKGIPSYIVVKKEVPTSESDGTIVKVPVRSNEQVSRFREEVDDMFKYWDTPVLINGVLAKKESKNVLKTKTSFLTKSITPVMSYKVNNIFNTKFVLIGPFLYKIPVLLLDKIDVILEQDNEIKALCKKLKSLSEFRKLSRVLVASIGELEIAPSRERIEVTDKNAEILTEKYKEAVKDTLATIESNVKKVKEVLREELSNIDNSTKTLFTSTFILPTITQEKIKQRIRDVLQDNIKPLLRDVVITCDSSYFKHIYPEVDETVNIFFSSYRILYNSITITSPFNKVYYTLPMVTLDCTPHKVTRYSLVYMQEVIKKRLLTKIDTPILFVLTTNNNTYKNKLSYTLRTKKEFIIDSSKNSFKVTTDNYIEVSLQYTGNLAIKNKKDLQNFVDAYFPSFNTYICMNEKEVLPFLSARKRTSSKVAKKPINKNIGYLYTISKKNQIVKTEVTTDFYKEEVEDTLLIATVNSNYSRDYFIAYANKILSLSDKDTYKIFIPLHRELKKKV